MRTRLRIGSAPIPASKKTRFVGSGTADGEGGVVTGRLFALDRKIGSLAATVRPDVVEKSR